MNPQGTSAWSCADPNGWPKDLLPSGNIVTLGLSPSGFGSQYVLAEMDAQCKDVAVGSLPADAHEARIDGIDGTKVVGIAVQGCRQVAAKCEGILHFDRSTGRDSMPIDLGRHFDLSTDWGSLSTTADWMHTNAASTGSDNNFVVGLRHLSAVVSFDYTSRAKQWVLSSEISSNFTFDQEASKFYNAHDAHQLSNGNILLFDNGNVGVTSGSRNFSRGAEYELDFQSMTATLVWEFRVSFCNTMGSARRLSNGHTLVHCSHCTSASGTGVVYEVDVSGTVVSTVELTTQTVTYRAQAVDTPPHLSQSASIAV